MQKQKKMMVVCSDLHNLETHPICEDWKITWAGDANAAMAKGRREHFDLAVLISTGSEMDLTETFLNLNDIRQSMPIAVMVKDADDNNSAFKPSFLLINAKVLSVKDFGPFLEALSDKNSPVIRALGLQKGNANRTRVS